LGGYSRADLVLLAELVIRGRFIEVPERLFVRRLHPQASWKGSGRYEGFAQWFDTSRSHRIVFPTWRLTREFFAAIAAADVSAAEKSRMATTVLGDFAVERRRTMLGEVARLRHLVLRN
jgi:hypothetical protein